MERFKILRLCFFKKEECGTSPRPVSRSSALRALEDQGNRDGVPGYPGKETPARLLLSERLRVGAIQDLSRGLGKGRREGRDDSSYHAPRPARSPRCWAWGPAAAPGLGELGAPRRPRASFRAVGSG